MSEQKDTKATGNGVSGSVLVVGGGIAGIQASNDLGDSGIKVYLATSDTAIGGRMAQLDKTFPTNDCAMCMLSPKLIETGSHPNVDIIVGAELDGLDGDPGNFTAHVKKRPLYVNPEKCTGCGQCAGVCPVDAPNRFNMGMDMRKAVYKLYPQAIPSKFFIEKKGTAPCKSACPAHISVQGYVALIAKGEHLKANALIRERNPLPAACGRVCTHPCETACTRSDVDSSVAIKQLKRFTSDREVEAVKSGKASYPEMKVHAPDAKKVGVIGSGPAGLTVAYDLGLRGFKVTVYEQEPELGGMLRYGIPHYRLPKDVLDHDIEYVRRAGVEFVVNCRVGRDVPFDKIRAENEAVFVGVGAWESRKLGLEGEDLEGVMHGIDFLEKIGRKAKTGIGDKVAIIGGGNTAVDAARSALRLGAAEVTVLYRRSRKEMPADPEEIDAMLEEGVKVVFLVAPTKLVGKNGRVSGVECIRMELGPPDGSGRRRPTPIQGSEFVVECDTVIPAVSQEPDVDLFAGKKEMRVTDRGLVQVDPESLVTSMEGVFAGGDTVSGAAFVIEAIAAGKRAADSIERFLKGEDMNAPRFEDKIYPVQAEDLPPTCDEPKADRVKMPHMPIAERIRGFVEVETGFSEADAIREAERCLNCGVCSECYECVKVCEQGAIDHFMTEETVDLTVGSVILAPGFDTFDPSPLTNYGYGLYPNVITSLEFERLMSASGPTLGHVARPSDHKDPKKVAIIQCVGSRDESIGRGYCSSVCCMYATKEAMIAKEHDPDIDMTIFYMDIRAHGKNFDLFYERAKNENDVKYIKSMISGIKEMPDTRNLLLRYVDAEGLFQEVEFDMVVLSVGLEPSRTSARLAEKLHIKTNGWGFCETDPFTPTQTSRPGVFVSGVFQMPKDVPETVAQATSAACTAGEICAPSRWRDTAKAELPPEMDKTGEPPRIGVYICRCGFNIGSIVDVPAVVEHAKTLPWVVHSFERLYACSEDSLSKIKEEIIQNKLNRIIVSSCTPRTHLSLFQKAAREAGLNKYYVEMANIREHSSWVHRDNPAAATEKANALLEGAVAKAARLRPLQNSYSQVVPKLVVLGGGVTGLNSALSASRQGFEVVLVERSGRLGGNMYSVFKTIEGRDTQVYLKKLIQDVEGSPKIEIVLNHTLKKIDGHVGHFKSTIVSVGDGSTRLLDHGALIVATGGMEYKPKEYLYGEDPRVMTQLELEGKLNTAPGEVKSAKSVVMIQCVGSRNEERPYCSRLCCTQAIKNAMTIKALNPETQVYVLFRDIRTYGFREKYYTEARDKGVVFIKFEDGKNPEVTKNGDRIEVAVEDYTLKRRIILRPDVLALSAAVLPEPSNMELADVMKTPTDANGFFCEAHVKLFPVDFANHGMFLCGLTHSPKHSDENIAQAQAAVSRATTILSKESLEVEGMVAVIDPEKCAVCLTCVRVCPFNVPIINEDQKAEIVSVSCQGCGSCVADCPNKAIQLEHFRDDQIIAQAQGVIHGSLLSRSRTAAGK